MRCLTRPNARLAVWMLALVVLLALWADEAGFTGAKAQEAAPAPAAEQTETADQEAEEESAEEEPESLGELIFKWPETTSEWVGLGFYVVLFVFSIAALSVALERILHLRRDKVIPQEFLDRLQGQLGSGRASAEELDALCDDSNTPIAGILKAGVRRAGRPLLEVEKAMEDAAVREVVALRARHRPLSVIGSVAPLVGLLGTVIGMIFAFQVSSQAGLGKAELLAKGIYLALLTTAGGLTIAIPCLLLVAWFNAQIERFMREIDEHLLETVPSFTRMEQNAAGTAGPPGDAGPASQGASHATAAS